MKKAILYLGAQELDIKIHYEKVLLLKLSYAGSSDATHQSLLLPCPFSYCFPCPGDILLFIHMENSP